MRSTRLSATQLCCVTIVLSVVVYYLVRSNGDLCFKERHFHHLQPQPGSLHVLVTGGAGYIGSHASKQLLREGHAVTVVDNLSRGNIGAIRVLQRLAFSRFQFIQADLGDSVTLMQIFRGNKFDAVLHFAAVAYVGESMTDPLRYYRNITANVLNVLEAMRTTGVTRLIFSSTCAVYGNPGSLPVTEDTETHPINPYGRAKLMAEQAIQDFCRSDDAIEAVILRYFNVYGSDPDGELGEYPSPSLRQHSRISGACLDAALRQTESLTITGTTHPTKDGTCVRDFIHVSDLVNAHIRGLQHITNPPGIFNVGTGQGISVRQFVQACKAVTGAQIVVTEKAEARHGDYAEIWADATKLRNVMGWEPRFTDVETSLRHAWKWRQQHPDGY